MTPNHPLVSIITPTFNHEHYIRQCIESVLTQTYPHWEQIIIDDGSSDGTAEVVRKIDDDRIRLVIQPHRGIFRLAETYNQALRIARGELIAILEGDDFWPPDKLATLVPALVDPEIILAFGQTIVTTPEGKPTGRTIPEPSFLREYGKPALFNSPVGAATRAMLFRPMYTYTFPCSVVIRRGTLESIGGFQHTPDVPFVDYQTFATLSLCGRYFYTPRVTGYWRRHKSSATTHRRPDITHARLLEFIRRFIRKNRGFIELSPQDTVAINNALTEWECQIAIYLGRAALVEGRWGDARAHFRSALNAKRAVVRAKAAVGLSASYLHVNLEGLVEIRARLFDPETRWTSVYRIPRNKAAEPEEPCPDMRVR